MSFTVPSLFLSFFNSSHVLPIRIWREVWEVVFTGDYTVKSNLLKVNLEKSHSVLSQRSSVRYFLSYMEWFVILFCSISPCCNRDWMYRRICKSARLLKPLFLFTSPSCQGLHSVVILVCNSSIGKSIRIWRVALRIVFTDDYTVKSNLLKVNLEKTHSVLSQRLSVTYFLQSEVQLVMLEKKHLFYNKDLMICILFYNIYTWNIFICFFHHL